MVPPKKTEIDDEAEEAEEEDEFEEDTFTCRLCGKETELGDGDDHILVCDHCAESYDLDRFWKDFDDDKITEEELKTIDLSPYLDAKKAAKKAAKKGAKKLLRKRRRRQQNKEKFSPQNLYFFS